MGGGANDWAKRGEGGRQAGGLGGVTHCEMCRVASKFDLTAETATIATISGVFQCQISRHYEERRWFSRRTRRDEAKESALHSRFAERGRERERNVGNNNNNNNGDDKS